MAFASERAQYQAGDLLFHQGDTADACLYHLSGGADIHGGYARWPAEGGRCRPWLPLSEKIAILMDVPRSRLDQSHGADDDA